jgi:hypothetical protein
MRRTRVIGTVATTVVALGLTALAVTSANAAGDGGDGGAYKPATTAPGDDIPADKPAGMSIQRTADGLELRSLTQDEVDDIEGWQPAE